MLNRLILFFLRNGVIVAVLVAALVIAGLAVMPFDTPFDGTPFRDRVPVDAIPDISENQVIVAADWPGRTPQDVEDQVTYPLSTALQGIPRVVDIRGISGFGMSRIYVVFEDGVDFYWARSRLLEKLATIGGAMPDGVTPSLGPDATALGQIFWYTVDGPDQSLDDLRAVQDFEVRYALQAVDGVAEVASVGGQVREYQVNLDPARLRSMGLTIPQIAAAIRASNLDVGATTINSDDGGSEFLVRGVGFVRRLADVRETVVATHGNTPVHLQDVGEVTLGPAFRRGALADATGERVGGVVAMRFGANPKEVIDGVKDVIERLNRSLDARGITITPFYDRTQLIDETLGTLTGALVQELIVTVIVVLLFLLHVRTSLIVAVTLPLAVLASFVAMKLLGVDSNIMSLAGIAIAIGVMVDIGIVMSENAYNYLLDDAGKRPPAEPVGEAAVEVGGALMTAVSTTVVSFLPVFFLTGQEGKLFTPLAWTKTFCMVAAVVISIVLVPLLCRLFLPPARGRARWRRIGVPLAILAIMVLAGLTAHDVVAAAFPGLQPVTWGIVAGLVVGLLLWRASRETLTPIEENPVSRGILRVYQPTLRWVLRHKLLFLCLPVALVILGLMVWLGAATVLSPVLAPLEAAGVDTDRVRPIRALADAFPGIGEDFMPPLDEGSLLYMPSLLPQASLQETLRAMMLQNRAMKRVPEVSQVMGKLGRAESPLDPAPIGMIETVVNLRPRSEWRPGLTVDDIVADLKYQTAQVGVQPSWLQPIETRVVMLQSGIRAKMALKVYGTDPAALEQFCIAAESIIRDVPGAVDVTAQRASGKPYLEFHLDRSRLATHGVDIRTAANVIQLAFGDMPLTTTVEGRERYAIRVRYPRELRSRLDHAGEILVPTTGGGQVPMRYLADIEVRLGPAMILTENGFVWSYVNFNSKGRDPVGVVDEARERLEAAIADGTLVPPDGMTKYEFAGTYENQQRATSRLAVLVPAAIGIILFLLYLHFREVGITLLVLAGLPVAMAGGFLFIQAWAGVEQVVYAIDQAALGGTYPTPDGNPTLMTVAVWVGLIALFGIAIDDGVVISTYIQQVVARRQPATRDELHAAVLEAGSRRIRPALMTSVTTLAALAPVLWATGRGSDVARPMAMPVFGGMLVAMVTILVVPCVYTLVAERRLPRADDAPGTSDPDPGTEADR